MSKTRNNYNSITELPNTQISTLQLQRSFQRYMFGRALAGSGRLIEVGCGGGQGLNLFLNISKEIIGYDIDEKNIEICKNNYNDVNKIKFIKADIETIDFEPNSIDTCLLFETIYYIKEHDNFFKKLHVSLESKGKVIICSANKEWHAFNPSPFSTKYFSIKELNDLGEKHSFEVEIFTSFEDRPKSFIDKTINLIKRFAVRYNLIPKTMVAKVLLKKIFSGKMEMMPKRFELNTTDYISPTKVESLEEDLYNTAIFAVFTKK